MEFPQFRVLGLFLVGITFLSGCIGQPMIGSRGESPDFVAHKVDYQTITGLNEIDRELAYIALTANDSFIVFENRTVGEEYHSVGALTEVNGSIAFIAKTVNGPNVDSFIVHEGTEHGVEYAGIGSLGRSDNPLRVGDKLTYVARDTPRGNHFIVFGGEEFGEEFEGISRYRRYTSAVNGIPAYVAERDGNPVVVYNGSVVSDRFRAALAPTEVNRTLAYNGYNGTRGYIAYDGTLVGKGYDDARTPVEVGGKLAYKVSEGDDEFVIFNKTEGPRYDRIQELQDINGVPAYIAWANGTEFVVVNGQEGQKYADIVSSTLTEVNGTAAYVASDDRPFDYFLVYGGIRLGEEFDKIGDVTAVNGKLVFTGQKQDNWYLVREK